MAIMFSKTQRHYDLFLESLTLSYQQNIMDTFEERISVMKHTYYSPETLLESAETWRKGKTKPEGRNMRTH